MAKPKLRVVDAPKPEPASTDYEWQQRARIARTDWAALHTKGDRSAALRFVTRAARRILGGGIRTERGGWTPEGRA